MHRETHHDPCSCVPEIINVILNGVSSNSVAGAKGTDDPDLQPIFTRLDEFKSSQEDREIMLVVSTADGFFTNTAKVVERFQPYQDHLNLTYLVHETGTAKSRYLRVSDIVSTIRAIENEEHVELGAEATLLVLEWSQISLAKLRQSQGKHIVRSNVTAYRNGCKIKEKADCNDTPAVNDRITDQDPQTRVYRFFQTSDGVTNGSGMPKFKELEEQRMP